MPTIQELFELASRRHQAGDLGAARALYRQVLDAEPGRAEAWHFLGLAEHQLGRHEQAIELIHRAVALDGANPTFHSNLGVICAAAGRLNEGETCYREALRLQPDLAAAHNNLGNVLKELGKLDEARGHFGKALRLKPDYAEAHNNLGAVLKELGRVKEAEACYRRALHCKPDYASAQTNLGTVLLELGKPAEAEECHRRAIRLQPDLAAAHQNLGNALASQGRLEEAEQSYRRALQIKPDFAEALSDLGNVLKAQGRLAEAEASQRQVLVLKPNYAAARCNLGNALLEQGKEAAAEDCYRQALRIKPDYVEAHHNLGTALMLQGKSEAAAAEFRQALGIKPDFAEAHQNLGDLLLDQGRFDEAASHFQQILGVKNSPRARIRLATMLPPIYVSTSDLGERRQRLIADVRRLHEEGVKLDPDRELPPSVFYLAYQGFDDRDLMRDLSQLYRNPKMEVQPTARRASGKLRVGFFSRFFYGHAVGGVVKGFIAHLARQDFSVHVLGVGSPNDEMARFIQEYADQFVSVPANVPAARRLIGQLGLDVLFYADIGMDPMTYALAHSRLAPVQCVHPGHPVTTGIETIDYFISSALMEPAEGERHYTETLVRFKNLPVYYQRPPVPSSLKGRAHFGLPEDRHLYACFQTLFKLHPEFDSLLGEILRRDPRGLLLLIHGNYSAWNALLLERFARTISDVTDRIRFLPRQSHRDFLNLAALCDVMLDPIHFGGGTTSYECFATGTPIVTLPAELMRGRVTLGMYRKMGVLDGVAENPQQYVELAVQLGTDRDANAALRQKILAANSALYEDIEAVRELEAFFKEARSKVE